MTTKKPDKIRNRFIFGNKRIYWLIYLVTLDLGLYMIASTDITYIGSSDIGLLTKLKISFWLGLFLICLLLNSDIKYGIKSNYMIVATLFIMMFYLYYIPTLIQENPSITFASYYPSSESRTIISTGHISEIKESSSGLMNYNSWPAFSSMSTILQLLPDVSLDNLIKYFPIIIITLYVTFAFLILKTITSDISSSFLGTVWFLSSFFVNSYYFGPQSFAYITYLISFMLLLKLFYSAGNVLSQKTILIILFVSILFFHGLTPILTLVMLISLYLCQIGPADSYKNVTNRNIFQNLIVLFVILVIIYNMYLSYKFFDVAFEKIYDVALGSEKSLFIKRQKE